MNPDNLVNNENDGRGTERLPLVSVCCLSYNHEPYLQDALESFLKQKRDFMIEIVIHDDASTDGSAGIIREYEKAYPEIMKPLYQTENQYSRGIRNISGVYNFPRARGKYIAMCEGDDYWISPDKLLRQVEYMEAHPECAMCCHAAEIVSMDGAFRSEQEIRPFQGTRVLAPEELISKRVNLPMASLMFRTEYAKALPAWYFSCSVGDIPLQLFMLTKGTVYYMDEKLSAYRMGREGSWQESMDGGAAALKWEQHYRDMARLYEAFDRETDGKWQNAVTDSLARIRFLTDLKKGKDAAVLDPANRKYLDELPKTERLLLGLKARHGRLYALLRGAYLKLKGGGPTRRC